MINPNVDDIGLPGTQPNEWRITLINPGPATVTIIANAECANLVDVPEAEVEKRYFRSFFFLNKRARNLTGIAAIRQG